MHQSPAQPMVSSSSTLWAQASKEWVIPAKPKPGRKPKKEPPLPPVELEETDSKGRRVQNRAAQRAFRERKQSQLAELQARVQSYEQGEIERNVALQNIAKRLKDENEALRQENAALKDELCRLKKGRESIHDNDRKRWRDDGLSISSINPFEPIARKRLRTGTESPISHMTQTVTFFPPSPSMASSPDSNAGSNHAYSPLPYLPPSRAQSVFPNQPPSVTYASLKQFEASASFGPFDCGLCNDDTPCVCREMALQEVAASLSAHKPQTLKIEGVDHVSIIPSRPSQTPSDSNMSSSPSAPAPLSILDNLPAYQPPVPLRRNGRPSNTAFTPIFQIRLPSPEPSEPVCTGDPSNCPACADDAFGKAFCSAIGDAVCSNPRCTSCPGNSNGSSSTQSAPSQSAVADALRTISLTPVEESPAQPQHTEEQQPAETIPCNDAWRQLKSHPNIAFADLSMLADVVVRRTKCAGPGDVLSPAPGSTTPERNVSVPAASREDDQPILLVDPHARYHEQISARSRPSSPPSLVSRDAQADCGQKRVREVDAAGVREALRLLDGQFATQ